MNFIKRVNGSWVDTPNYIHKTDTDTFTTLPADIYANSTTATVGLKGNTVQSGTPTPDNPIIPQGTGERTAQLFDNANNIELYYLDSSTGEYKSTGSTSRTALIKCTAENVYTINAYSRTFRVAFYSSKPTNGTAAITFYNYDYGSYDTHVQTVTAPQNAQYMAFFCYNSGTEAQTYTEGEIFSTVMINTGSTALPYEPYGYKIPISSAGQTSNIYLGEMQTTRKIRKLVLTGEEEWTFYSYPDVTRFAIIVGNTTTNGGLCTHYTWRVQSGGTTDHFYANNSGNVFFFSTTISTVSDFKSYLAAQYAAGTPVTVWYVLATPETAVVNEPLMKIGDYADEVSGISIPVTAGGDTISVDTTLQPSEVTVNYKGWHPVTDVHERSGGAWD